MRSRDPRTSGQSASPSQAGGSFHSETLESLSEGLQNALWHLGGVPFEHRIDRMSAAVNNLSDAKEFTQGYEGLLRQYRIRVRLLSMLRFVPRPFAFFSLPARPPAGGVISRIKKIFRLHNITSFPALA